MVRILIIEDEKPISEFVRLSLKKAGYQCVCVYNGADAADILESGRFNLILLDVMLPEIDGFELMEYTRPTGMPVILITAKNSVSDRVKGLRIGAASLGTSSTTLPKRFTGWTSPAPANRAARGWAWRCAAKLSRSTTGKCALTAGCKTVRV